MRVVLASSSLVWLQVAMCICSIGWLKGVRSVYAYKTQAKETNNLYEILWIHLDDGCTSSIDFENKNNNKNTERISGGSRFNLERLLPTTTHISSWCAIVVVVLNIWLPIISTLIATIPLMKRAYVYCCAHSAVVRLESVACSVVSLGSAPGVRLCCYAPGVRF